MREQADANSMEPDVSNALELMAAAVRELFQDAGLVYADPGERHVVSKLCRVLEPRFPEHEVSNEYDRREQDVKKLGKTKITPDLIIHKIGVRESNLLVIEVKLVSNNDFASDVFKLRGMTGPDGDYRYAAGVHLVLDIPNGRVAKGDVYVDGVIDDAPTQHFASQFT